MDWQHRSGADLHRTPGINWSVDRIEELKRRWANEETCSEIGAAMGVSRCAVIGKVHRLGLEGRKRTNRSAADIERAKRETAERNARNKRFKRQTTRGAEVQEPIAAMPVFIGSLNIPFADLRDFSNHGPNECRFIADEPPGPDYRSCGNQTLPGESYCGNCYLITRNQSTLTQAERALFVRMGRQNHLRAQRRAVA